MKLFRFGLNAWMTLVSLASFLLGWVVLAHAPKPVQPTQASVTFSAQILPELSPVPNWGFGSDEAESQQFMQSARMPSNAAPMPIFRTGGS